MEWSFPPEADVPLAQTPVAAGDHKPPRHSTGQGGARGAESDCIDDVVGGERGRHGGFAEAD